MSKIKIVEMLLIYLLFHITFTPVNIYSQDSVKVKKTDSTEITKPLPKWLLDQKKNQTAKKEQPTDILKSKNYFLYSVLLTAIFLIMIVVSVSIIIVKRSRHSE
jgi:hypothetical protein